MTRSNATLPEEKELKRSGFARGLTGLVLFALVLLVLFKFTEVKKVAVLLGQFPLSLLLLALLLQAGTYLSVAKTYQELLATFRQRLSLLPLTRTALAVNFMNIVLPTGGVSGSSYLVRFLSRRGVSGATGTTTAIIYYLLYYLSFFVILIFGYIGLFFRSELSLPSARAVTLIVSIIIFMIWSLLLIFGGEQRFSRRIMHILRLLNRVMKAFGKQRPAFDESAAKRFLDELYSDLRLAWGKRGQLYGAVAALIALHLFDLATLFVILAGLGVFASFSILIVGYALASILSLLSFFTAGLGVYEFSMVGVLVGLGLPLEVTVTAVLIFRALTFWLPLPVGYYFYRHPGLRAA